MKAHLMYRDADFDLSRSLPANAEILEADLGLGTVYAAMAGDDKFLYDVARHALLSELADPVAIDYRQQVLRDCVVVPDVVRQIYDLAVEAVLREHKIYIGIFRMRPSTILSRSVEVLQMFIELLHRLRRVAETGAERFTSPGFTTFFAMLTDQLSDEYFHTIEEHLRTLKFRSGMLMSASLGKGNKGMDYVLRTPIATRRKLSDLFHRGSKLSFTLPDRDEAGFQALADLHDRGLNLVANATAQSADHILSFFQMLRAELGFYVGCLNLYQTLYAKGAPVVEPQAIAQGGHQFTTAGLYDVALALAIDTPAIGNDIAADGKDLIVITGANQGGKSTLLRSIGLAQLMMQAGMFVPAKAFRADVSTGVFTHYKREEDSGMRSGKLDEEMARMSDIADHVRPGGLLLCNESFASTNEREGSEISRQIITALLKSRVRVCFVTHLYDLSEGLYRQRRDDALFLRAERQAGGARSFRVLPGEPLPTSFGPDLYDRIFSSPPDPASRGAVKAVAVKAVAVKTVAVNAAAVNAVATVVQGDGSMR